MNIPGDLGAKYDNLCGKLDQLAATMERLAVQNDQLHSVAYKEWEELRIADGANAVSNTATITIPVCANGWQAKIERVSITAAGASSGANVSIYRGASDPTNLIDWASGMFGNTPSKTVADYASPIYFENNDSIVIVVASLAGATEAVTVRIEGHRRQV